MKSRTLRTFFLHALVALTLVCMFQSEAAAQVVEERKGDANPAKVIFLATLYGAGTGLALGGAYALIEDGDDPSTGEVLRWGTAGGAAGGLLIGLVHVMTRSEPQGSAEEVGLLELDGMDAGFAVPTVRLTAQRSAGGNISRSVWVNIVTAEF